MNKKEVVLTPQQKVIDYFTQKESHLGYSLLLKGVRHFGYYPAGQEKISMAEAQRLMVEKLYEELNLKSNSLLLDAGCGEGEVAIYLATKYQFQIEGVDLLKLSIDKANKKRVQSGLEKKVNFQVMDYMKLDFSDEIFDGVYTMETLVHAPDYNRVLREFYRLLKPKGKLVLFEYSTRSLDNFPSRLRKIRKLVIEESGMHSLPHFLHGKFPEILKNTGFTDVSVKNITPRVIPMLKKLYLMAYLPYQLIKLLRLQRKFINTTSSVEGYKNFIKNDFWRYNIITAIKD